MKTRRISTVFLVLLVLPFLLAAPVRAAEITNRWPGDGTAEDAVGDDDGIIAAGVTFGDGLIDQGFAFDGTDGEIAFGADAGNFGESDLTIAFVIRTTSARLESVLSKRSLCQVSPFWDIRMNTAGRLGLEYRDSSSSTSIGTTASVNDGLFHIVEFTREGQTMSAYVDGRLDNQIEFEVVSDADNGAELRAGSGACVGLDGTFRFTGMLDEIILASEADPDILPPFFHCGDANLNHAITASDALAALQTAVGTNECHLCLCDTNDSGGMTAGDALAILRKAVGQPVELGCPLCPLGNP